VYSNIINFTDDEINNMTIGGCVNKVVNILFSNFIQHNLNQFIILLDFHLLAYPPVLI
jgi:hypothetical protein